MLQALEHGEGVGVASVGIVDVGAVEVDVALVLGRAGLYDAEQGISLVEVSRLDVCDGEVEGHLVAFLVAESVELAAFEAVYGVLVVLLIEERVGDKGIDAVLIGRVGMGGEVGLQGPYAVLLFQFVGGAGNHVVRLAPLQERLSVGLDEVFQCTQGGSVVLLDKQLSAFLEESSGRSDGHMSLCHPRGGECSEQGE